SLMDTWLLLSNRESNGEHNRQLYLLKSRGMAHSNQVREFILSAEGIKLREAYVRTGGRADRLGTPRAGGQGEGYRAGAGCGDGATLPGARAQAARDRRTD